MRKHCPGRLQDCQNVTDSNENQLSTPITTDDTEKMVIVDDCRLMANEIKTENTNNPEQLTVNAIHSPFEPSNDTGSIASTTNANNVLTFRPTRILQRPRDSISNRSSPPVMTTTICEKLNKHLGRLILKEIPVDQMVQAFGSIESSWDEEDVIPSTTFDTMKEDEDPTEANNNAASKSFEQRKLEYAEARMRIMGHATVDEALLQYVDSNDDCESDIEDDSVFALSACSSKPVAQTDLFEYVSKSATSTDSPLIDKSKETAGNNHNFSNQASRSLTFVPPTRPRYHTSHANSYIPTAAYNGGSTQQVFQRPLFVQLPAPNGTISPGFTFFNQSQIVYNNAGTVPGAWPYQQYSKRFQGASGGSFPPPSPDMWRGQS